MQKRIVILFGCLIFLVGQAIAQEECSALVQQALETAEDICAPTARNQGCYGNLSIEATPQSDATNFQFTKVGDIANIATFQSIQLSSFDSDAGVWGLMLMQVQANVPDTSPGQNVTVLMFGDVHVQNAATSQTQQEAPEQQLQTNTSDVVNIRAFPSTRAAVIGKVTSADPITANGRTDDGTWVRIRYGTQTGWIFSPLLTPEEPKANLAVVDSDIPFYGPMQAFYFSTGIGQSTCNAVPEDGMLVQTPEGVASITLFINEVSVEMGSTIYFHVDADHRLLIAPVEGAARVGSGGQSQTVVEGGYVTVPLNESLQASDAPTEPQSYLGDTNMPNLPVSALEQTISINPGLDQDGLDTLLKYKDIFNFLAVKDADEFLDYMKNTENPDIPAYLLQLGYTDFGAAIDKFLISLGYNLDNYPTYTADDARKPSKNNGGKKKKDDDDDDDDD